MRRPQSPPTARRPARPRGGRIQGRARPNGGGRAAWPDEVEDPPRHGDAGGSALRGVLWHRPGVDAARRHRPRRAAAHRQRQQRLAGGDLRHRGRSRRGRPQRRHGPHRRRRRPGHPHHLRQRRRAGAGELPAPGGHGRRAQPSAWQAEHGARPSRRPGPFVGSQWPRRIEEDGGPVSATSTPRSSTAYDVVVIGSGIAGLVAALTAAPRARVAVLTKAALDEGCSRHAQGGIAAAVGPEDSPELHYADTVAAGRGLCDEPPVRILVEEGPRRVRELVEWGVGFDTQDGLLMVGREAAHSRPRILHARGDATGLAIETALIDRLRARGVDVFERHHATRPLTTAEGRCRGVETVDVDTNSRRTFAANAVVLASGGAGRLWRNTTNPEPATGDGIALAWEAGAEVAGMEFVQFHPTALALEGAPRFLISEAVRGEGALVVNARGERFLFSADQRGELAPRDVVAQAV